jgi:hypothetical protein
MLIRYVCVVLLSGAAGCATDANNKALVDPLKQRLLAREDIALQNLLLARAPAYSYSGGGRGGAYSYLDAPYDGPAIEPPLPDLNMLPEDMPPWDDFPEETPASEPQPQPTPIQPVPTDDEPGLAAQSEVDPAPAPSVPETEAPAAP